MRVAVIGAGFSGMLSAYLLEKAGIEVTIFEKEDYIGGHCRSIVSKDVYTELGTVFSFNNQIKELLIELKIDYTESRLYKKYVDENHQYIELLSEEKVRQLIEEIEHLKNILKKYERSLSSPNFDYIHKDLLANFYDFANDNNLNYICQIIKPFLSAFGFGNLEDLQAYYVFKVFDIETLYTFIQGGKLISFKKGISELIDKLGQNITDIRYSLEVINVEVVNDKVKVESLYETDYFDKVLISTKLPRDVIKDELYNSLMKKIETNPFLSCVYEVMNKDLATTYFKANLGKKDKIQFFYASRQNHRTTLVAYAYGHASKALIDGITNDLKALNINIKQLVTVKEWYIFPHLNNDNLTENFYHDVNDHQKTSNICLIGSLVSEPSLSNLYVSIKQTIDTIIENYQEHLI